MRIDTSAGVLIIVVVFGHALSSVQTGVADAALQWIFLFHMPAFVWMSGYLTRWATSRSLLDLAGRLLFPFLVFQLLHRWFIAVWEERAFSSALPNPAWSLWYLVALFAWRLMAPLLRQIPFAVPVTVIASLAVGAVPMIGEGFSLSRIIAFLPFFTLGLLWKSEWLDVLRAPWIRMVALLTLGVAAAWALVAFTSVDRRAWWLSWSYERMEQSTGEGVVTRFAVLIFGALLAICVLSLTLRNVPWLASIGRATLPVYLLHPLVLYPWHLDGAPSWLSGVGGVVLLLGASIGLAYALSRSPVIRATRPLMDYRWWARLARSAGSKEG